ncbi:MAG: tetratricopeptide repeat protein [Chloroflexaceae bacterium]|nr:tetratricopeptide repeat protein [Chloroflexaceae bacterium]
MDQHLSLPFVGYQSELAFIDSLIAEWGTRRIVCIDAPAGRGKTRLLQEIHRRHTVGGGEKIPLRVSGIINFEDLALHKLQNVGCTIAHMLGEKIFEPYLRVLLNWRRMEMSGVGLEQLTHTARAVNQTFVDCFNMISARVVLLIDATDALELEEHTVMRAMAETGRKLDNVVVVLAGCNARSIGEALLGTQEREVTIITLPTLTAQAAEMYLFHRQEQLPVTLAPGLVQKIIFLCRGRPIMLDLALQRFSREVPLAWLTERSLEDLRKLPDDQRQQCQWEFERELAHYIADTTQLKGWLPLLMSRVHPVDAEMIGTLLAVPDDTASALFEKARSAVWVKPFPDGHIGLYDEIRHLVNEYVWPEIDPSGERQRQHGKRTIDYLERRADAITHRLEHLRKTGLADFEEPRIHIVCTPFLERTRLEQELRRLYVRQLCATLLADSTEGVRTFVRMFDQATRSYNFHLRKLLVGNIQHYRELIPPEHWYDLDSRRIEHLLDVGDYAPARDLATHLLEPGDALLPEQRVVLLVRRGYGAMKLGSLAQSITDFEQAMRVSQEYDCESLFARAQLARGRAYSHQGRFDAALDDYLGAYQICLKMGDFFQTAWILGDISYIHALKGNQYAAMESCLASLELWQELNAPRGLASAYVNMGEIYVRFNQPAEALSYYSKAMDIFVAQDDTEWMCMVRKGRAFAFQLRRELDKAEEDHRWRWSTAPLRCIRAFCIRRP